MENSEIKSNIAKNISELRKANKLTQVELAEKLNYSDKAISRWERGDTLPDIDVLCQICELFGVTFEYLISSQINTQEAMKLRKNDMANRLTITLLAISIVWFVATFIFVYSNIIFHRSAWTVFIWAVPLSCVVADLFNWKWGKKKYSLYLNSILNWSLLTAVYIQLLNYNTWLIFLLGIPIQISIILWSTMKPRTKNLSQNTKKDQE